MKTNQLKPNQRLLGNIVLGLGMAVLLGAGYKLAAFVHWVFTILPVWPDGTPR